MLGLKLALIFISWNEYLLSILLFSSTGVSGAELIQGSIHVILLNWNNWEVVGSLVLSVFCLTYTSRKSWSVFWLVSDLWCAVPCWLVLRLSVSPSLSESAGIFVVLMLRISRYWIFSFLVSDFSDCFKSFLMSKGKFYKSLKDHNAMFASIFSCMHSS